MTIRDHSNCTDPECFLCRVRSVGFAASAMPTRSPAAVSQKRFAAETETDLPAYKRLRDSGLQPSATKGAANIEKRATEKWEVETGQLAPTRSLARRQQKAFDDVKAMA